MKRVAVINLAALCVSCAIAGDEVCNISSEPTTGSGLLLPPEACVAPAMSQSDLQRAAEDDGELTWHASLKEALVVARESQRDVLVFATGDGCSDCLRMKADLFKDSYIQSRLGNLVLVRIDAAAPEAARLGVLAAPTLVRVSASGYVVNVREGLMERDGLLEMLREKPGSKGSGNDGRQ